MGHGAAYADALLGDVFPLVTSFLTGFDLLRLSHVNRKLLTELLAPDSPEWQQRTRPLPLAAADSDASNCTAKARYFQLSSVRFLGREIAETTRRDRGGAVEVWSRGLPSYWTSGSFSLELTFALLPRDAGSSTPTFIGGVLLGAQSVPWSTRRWADCHQQFVHVDPEGNLYCSVLDKKPVIAETLELERWYHVVLAFDRGSGGTSTSSSPLPTQRVFLDGDLVHEASGSLHSEWWNLRFGQIGSGCISGGSPGKPAPDFTGWYGFHGVVDDCRLWRGALSPDQIRTLAQGDSIVLSDGRGEYSTTGIEWSLRTSGCDPLGFASRVRCTRPRERVCNEVRGLADIDN